MAEQLTFADLVNAKKAISAVAAPAAAGVPAQSGLGGGVNQMLEIAKMVDQGLGTLNNILANVVNIVNNPMIKSGLLKQNPEAAKQIVNAATIAGVEGVKIPPAEAAPIAQPSEEKKEEKPNAAA